MIIFIADLTLKPIYQYNLSVVSLAPGDRQGFTAVYNLYYLAIYHFSKKILDNSQQAEDIAADAFIKLWRQAQEGNGIQNVRAFLHVAAKNACLDYLKSVRIHADKEKEISLRMQQDTDGLFGLAEAKAEVLEYVYEAIEKLPKKCKEIFKLSYIEGMKVNEVAQYLRISEQTVSNQKTRALKMLRLALHDKQWVLLIWLLNEL